MKTEDKKLKCVKCKHEWKQRGEKKPKQCPCCNNPNWHKRNAEDIVSLIIG